MELITGLQTTCNQTLSYFDLSEEELNKVYAPGKWNIRQLLHHLADAETVLYDRVRRVIAKPNQVIWSFDQEAWASKLDYQTLPLAHNKMIYQSVRGAVIYLAEQYYVSLGDNEFVHSQTGKRTLKEEFDKIYWHNEHHLRQIEQALGS